MKEKTIKISNEYITIGQLLKTTDVISSGGMAKWYLSEYDVFVNDEQDQRRGRKLRVGDVINLPNESLKVTITAK